MRQYRIEATAHTNTQTHKHTNTQTHTHTHTQTGCKARTCHVTNARERVQEALVANVHVYPHGNREQTDEGEPALLVLLQNPVLTRGKQEKRKTAKGRRGKRKDHRACSAQIMSNHSAPVLTPPAHSSFSTSSAGQWYRFVVASVSEACVTSRTSKSTHCDLLLCSCGGGEEERSSFACFVLVPSASLLLVGCLAWAFFASEMRWGSTSTPKVYTLPSQKCDCSSSCSPTVSSPVLQPMSMTDNGVPLGWCLLCAFVISATTLSDCSLLRRSSAGLNL